MKKLLFVLLLLLLGCSIQAVVWYEVYLGKLSSRDSQVIHKYADGIDLIRSVRIQAALLDEDIEWANMNLTEKQRALCVAIALALAKNRAVDMSKAPMEEIKEAAERAGLDEFRYVLKIQVFIARVDAEIDKYREKMKGITDREAKGLNLNDI